MSSIGSLEVLNAALNVAFIGAVFRSSNLESRINDYSGSFFALGIATCVTNAKVYLRGKSENYSTKVTDYSREVNITAGILGLSIAAFLTAGIISLISIPNTKLMNLENGSVVLDKSFFCLIMQSIAVANLFLNGAIFFTSSFEKSRIISNALSLAYLGAVLKIASWNEIRVTLNCKVPNMKEADFQFKYIFNVVNSDNPVAIKNNKAIPYETVVNEFVTNISRIFMNTKSFEIGLKEGLKEERTPLGNGYLVKTYRVWVRYCNVFIPKKFYSDVLCDYSKLFVNFVEKNITTRACIHRI